MSSTSPPYKTLTPHKFFDVTSTIVGREIKPGNTVSFVNEIDLTAIEDLRSTWNGERKPTYTAFIAKAAAIALQEFPYANRRLYKIPFLRTRMQTFQDVRIAVACERDISDVEVAAFMDVLPEAERKNLSQVTDWLFDLAHCDLDSNKQWRDFYTLISRFPAWLSSRLISLPLFVPVLWWKWRGGAMVISSPGKYGVDAMLGSWPAPLGVSFGFAKDRPIVRDKQMVVAKTMYFTLNFDRRIMAGAQAARFFKRMCDLLENPQEGMQESLK
ncbi:2-oxo acid dehydrogenase subunit E2 [Geoalkalibacter halelectricus]|uniref:2-oxo acid dehydrogenase subunit E2 n=1 Tax=Geoalkalibacter halelectricus TaxID=2847045 RepID=UPI003D2232A0